MSGWCGPDAPEDPGDLRALIVAARPELAGAAVRRLPGGWDCIAAEAGGFVFKVPRDADAARRLEGEARLLDALRPCVGLPVPDLALIRRPRLMSRHAKIGGGLLLAPDYAALPGAARERLAEDLARFFAELHAIPVERMRRAGAETLDLWMPPEEVLRRVWPRLPEALRAPAAATVAARANLGPDPLGEVFGHFDAHGWNMAWDGARGRLAGVFDFGDAGVAAAHHEFVAPSLISPDLTARVAAAYERLTGRAVDRGRVHVLTGSHRLWELAVEADDPTNVPVLVDLVVGWLATGPGVPATPT